MSVTAEKEGKWFSKQDLSSPEALKKAYRNLVKQYHPDAGGNTASMQEIVKAYQGGLKLLGTSAYRDISAARESGKPLTKESPAVQNAISILNQSSEIAKIAGTDRMASKIFARLQQQGLEPVHAQKQAELITAILGGTRISGHEAAMIATSEPAMTILSQLTGQAINTDAPQSVPNKIPAVVFQSATAGLPMAASHGFGTEYGKKGAAAFAVFRRGEADLDAYSKRFDRYYKSGRIGLRFEQIPADPTATYPELAKAAFDAGVMDAKGSVISRGVQGSAGNQGSAFFPQRGIPTTIPHTAVSHVSPETLHVLESQYGKKGAAAFAVFRRGEADLDAYSKRFDRYYKSGRIGLRFEQIPADPTATYPELAKAAFDAGVMDAKGSVISRGVQGSAGNQGSAFFPQRGIPTTIPHTAVSHVSPETLHALESQYGKKGAAAFAVFGRGEVDLDAYAKRFHRYYRSGRIGLSFDKIPADLIAESPHLAKVAFDAGVRDAKNPTVKSFAGAGQMGYNREIGKTDAPAPTSKDVSTALELGTVNSEDERLSIEDHASHGAPYDDNKVGRNLEGVSEAGEEVVQLAKSWQGSVDYPGIDDWTYKVIPKGTKIWGGVPGQSNFYTTQEMMDEAGNDATKIFEGLQVGKGAYPTYRGQMAEYEVQNDIVVGYSKALENQQYGAGGFDQYFVKDFGTNLKQVNIIDLINR